MRSRILNGALAALVAATGLVAATQQQAQATPPGNKDVTATLFQWTYASVAKECTSTLGPDGYGFVEVSPATEQIQGSQWWTSYQPVSYKLANHLGDESSFANMVSTCHGAGVKVIADAVINHMTAGSGTGTAGTAYTQVQLPRLLPGPGLPHLPYGHHRLHQTATTCRTANWWAWRTSTPAATTSAAPSRAI